MTRNEKESSKNTKKKGLQMGRKMKFGREKL